KDMFLAKIGAGGNIVWAVSGGGNGGDDYGTGVALDAEGNLFVCGVFEAQYATFGDTVLTNSRPDFQKYKDTFLAKYDPSGELLWARQFSGTGDVEARGMATDATGNCYLTGSFFGEIFLYPTNLTTSSPFEADLFLVKFDPEGHLVWATQAGGPTGSDWANGIAVDDEGNIYLSGFFEAPASFGSTNLSASAGVDAFAAKYDTNGDLIWVKQFGGVGNDHCMNIATDHYGNSFLTGFFQQAITFGETTLTNGLTGPDDRAIFVTKLNASGEPLWAQSILGSTANEIWAASCDYNGSLFVSGKMSHRVEIGGLSLTNNNIPAGFFAQFRNNGKLLQFETHNAYHRASVADRHGSVYLTGTFFGTVNFGTNILSTSAAHAPFIAKRDADRPQISIGLAGDKLVLSWATNRPEFFLETSSDVNGDDWSIVPFSIENRRNYSTNSAASQGFFRLRKED
ncbi:MAG: SBBP repeat-containing protein, partial [Limisphaerales bacterium]